MQKISLTAGARAVTIFPASAPDRPLILLHSFSGDGSEAAGILASNGAPDHNLASIGKLDWDHDMAPWYCPPLYEGEPPFSGGADEYLDILTGQILPRICGELDGMPPFTGIAGYSLAGLFALYAATRCTCFDRIASMSGSLWFPGFPDYIRSHPMPKDPERIYLSLGDREDRTKNELLNTVRQNTESLAEHYRGQGIDVTWELNPGNHFKSTMARTAKGIAALL